MVDIENIKQILLEEKVIMRNSVNGKILLNPNIYRTLNAKTWEEIENQFGNKNSLLKEFFSNFRHDPKEIIYCLNKNLLEPEKCKECGEFLVFNKHRRRYNYVCKNCKSKNHTNDIKRKLEIDKNSFNLQLHNLYDSLKDNNLNIFEKLKKVFVFTGLARFKDSTNLICKKPFKKGFPYCNINEIFSEEELFLDVLQNFNIIENYLKSFSEDHFSFNEIFYCINHEMYEPKKCDICGNYCTFIGSAISGYYPDTCCHRCGAVKASINYEKEHGYKFSLQDPTVREKIKNTNLNNHGGVWNSQTVESKNKAKQTCLEKYGVENAMQNAEIAQRRRDSYKEKTGYEFATQNPDYWKNLEDHYMETLGAKHQWARGSISREKGKETCEKKYGVKEPLSSPIIREKIRKTNLEKYGVENCGSSPLIIKKREQTNLRKFGVKSPMQNSDFAKNLIRNYIYKNISFDSSWELAYYIWCEDHNIKIERTYESFEYYDSENISHDYYPDFKLNNTFIEIKGGHLIDSKGNLVSPYKSQSSNKEEDIRYHKTLLMKEMIRKNQLKILPKEFIKFLLNWVKRKYGKNYLKSFKNQKEEQK